MERLYTGAIQGSLLCLVIFTPLAFGGVYPWGIAVMELVALFMTLAWVLKLLYGRQLRAVRTPLNLPIILFLSLVGLQLLALPPQLMSILSPTTYALHQRTLAGWPEREPLPLIASAAEARSEASLGPQQAFGAAPISRWRPLSIYPHATWEAMRQALTYTAAFLIVVNTVQTRAQLARLLQALMVVGGAMAVVGLIQKASGTAKIYGWWQPQFGGSPFGPYVNRNHFAGYMAMVIPLGLGWLWGQLVQRDAGVAGWGWRARLKAVLGGRNGRLLLLVFALVNMAAALLFSASRGGIVSVALALVFFTLVVCLLHRKERRLGIVVPMVMACVLVYALWLGLDHVVERFFQPDEGRPLIWSGTVNLIGDYPLLGTGLGTYVSSFRRHQPTLGAGLVEHAHNDYLELLAETGVIGFLIVMGGLGWFCWRTLNRWVARHDPEMRGIVLGGMAGVLAMGLHSIVDFNLHIPANALTFAVILGVIAVAVHLRQTHGGSLAIFRVRELRPPRSVCLALYPLSMLATLWLALSVVQSFAADRRAQLAQSLEPETVHSPEPELLIEQWARAVALDPGHADYHYRLGLAYERNMRTQWTTDPSRALIFGLQAIAAYREAILRNPTSPFPYLSWGWALENVSRLAAWMPERQVRSATSLPIAGEDVTHWITQLRQDPERAAWWSRQLLQTATYLAPTAAFTHYSAGLHALQRWDMLSEAEQARALQELHSAIQLEPSYAGAILQAVWERTDDRALVQAMARGTPEEARWRGRVSADTLRR